MRVHFLGIGGSGASAAAAIAKSYGFEVTGCDKQPVNEFTKVFNKEQLFQDHSPDHLSNFKRGIDILAVTPAVYSLDPNNPELLAAQENGLEILTWQEFMGKYLEKDKYVIAVCGTHGKSTTTAMIGLLLEDAGLDPTVELGAIVPKWGTNYRIGKGKYFSVKREGDRSTKYGGIFVTEADEFNDNFLASHPSIAVVTNIEFDHPEYFKNFEAVKKSFVKFLSQTKQTIIANLSDKEISEVLASQGLALQGCPVINYSAQLIDFPLKIPGDFNILNASAVYQVGKLLGIDEEIIKKSLANYHGLSKRFELVGEYKGAKVYSDFGHHPTEIKVTVEAVREMYPDNKIWVIFQPHMFTRTKVLFDDFVIVFQNLPTDKIIITDIYPSREVDTGLVHSRQLVEALDKDTASYQPKDRVAAVVKQEVRPGDIIFFIGAGDIDSIARKLVKNEGVKIDESWYKKPSGISKSESAGGVVTRVEKGKIFVALVLEPDRTNYVLPKGHIEKGESIEETALREIEEEAGLDNVELITKLGVSERLAFDKNEWKVIHYFLYITEQKEAEFAMWFPIDKLPEMFWPEQKELIQANKEKIKNLLLA